jgi:hypothetical protein
MASRLLTRSAISPRPRTDVRFSLAINAVMIDLPENLSTIRIPDFATLVLFYLASGVSDGHSGQRLRSVRAAQVMMVWLVPGVLQLRLQSLTPFCYGLFSTVIP